MAEDAWVLRFDRRRHGAAKENTMPVRKYDSKNLSDDKLALIATANGIIAEYAQKGFDLTLRQLYYQFVARDLFPASWADPATGSTNNERSYKKLGDVIADGRMAGLIDWDAIDDMTRNLRKRAEWNTPAELLGVCADQYRVPRWTGHRLIPEVWVEKDAAIGVVSAVCEADGVSYFSCRGYTSLSAIWNASQRLVRVIRTGSTPVIIHLGDHDPSGIDMSRDIEARLLRFVVMDLARLGEIDEKRAVAILNGDDLVRPFEVRRIALNMDQVEQYSPPPNPAKLTDSRCAGYVVRFGDESWELDALDPTVVAGMVKAEIQSCKEPGKWRATGKVEDAGRRRFAQIRDRFDDVEAMLDGNGGAR